MLPALLRALHELFAPPLRRVVGVSLALAVASFAALWTAVAVVLYRTALFGWAPLDWLVDLFGAFAICW